MVFDQVVPIGDAQVFEKLTEIKYRREEKLSSLRNARAE